MNAKDVTKKQKDSVKLSDSPGMREMGLNALTLSFPAYLEKIFIEDYFEKSLQQVKISVFLAIVFFALFGILDVVLVPEIKKALWGIRFGFICPGLIVILIISFFPVFKKHMQVSVSVSMIWTGFGIIAMVVIAPPPASFSYYAGLILVFMYGYCFVRLRFVWAAFAGWTIVVFYEIAAIGIGQTPVPVLVNNNFFFISANIIGMFACYSMEYYARKDFFMAHLLEIEKEKVNAVNRKLEQRVEKRTTQLVKANEELRREMEERKLMQQELLQAQKMQAIGTLAGGIAHDFNNILTAIISYSEIGLYKKDMNKEKIKYSFEQILKAGGRAKEVIKQILTFSRQRDEQLGPVKIGGVVKEALKLISATLPKTIDIRENIMTDSDTVLADPTQIHQILMNLCTNAEHALREKGGVMEISLGEICIHSESQQQNFDLLPGTYLDLSVKDTGAGMEASVMERIFDPFFTTKGPAEGTGMGLSVVHGIAKSHGGKVIVESAVGKGTTVHVFFPKADINETSAVEKEAQMPLGNERILFVDDEEALIEVGQEMIEEFGYEVVCKTDPVEALAVFRAEPQKFDLVITDKSMPHMNGFEFVEKLLEIRPDTPAILCTGFSSTAELEKARAIGFRELIMKPVVMREMAVTIRRVLDQIN